MTVGCLRCLPALLLLCCCCCCATAAAGDGSAGAVSFKKCPQEKLDAREGSPVTAECYANVDSEAEPSKNAYQWQFRGKSGHFSYLPFRPTDRFEYKMDADDGSLHIRSVDRSNDGNEFICSRGQSSMTRCPKSTLNVFWLNTNFSVERRHPLRPIRLKDEVQLECSVDASEPPAVVYWFLNGKIFCNPSVNDTGCLRSREVTASGTRLKISSFSTQLAGVYHCYIEATAGKVLTRNPLAVLPQAYERHFGSPVLFLRKNSKVQLRSPYRKSSWSWLENFGLSTSARRPLPQHSFGQLTSAGLEIADDEYWRSSSVRFSKTNGYNETRTFIVLNYDGITFLYDVIKFRHSALDGNKDFEPPVLHNEYNIVSEGKKFVQRVYLPYDSREWVPRPTVRWTSPSGQPITSVEREGMQVERNSHLVIERAGRQHTGNYTVTISNLHVSVEKQIRLVVSFQPELHTGARTLTAWAGGEFTIDCPHNKSMVAPWPATTFSWLRQNKSAFVTVATASAAKPIGDSVWVDKFSGRLNFPRLSPEHSGTYKCRAATRMGPVQPWDEMTTRPLEPRTSGSVSLHVQQRLQQQMCPRLPAEILLEARVPDSVVCDFEGDSAPTIRWLRRKGGSFSEINPSAEGVRFSDGNTRMSVNYVDDNLAGEYRILGRRGDEEAVRDFSVVVGSKPKVQRVPADTVVLPGESVTFNCVATGTPRPNITWSFLGVGQKREFSFDPCRSGSRCSMANGTLLIPRAAPQDAGEYRCNASALQAVATSRPVRLSLQALPRGARTSMAKTIGIVVSCAVGYLGLIVFLSVFCTLRMQRRRQKQRSEEEQQQLQHQHQQPLQQQQLLFKGGHFKGSDVGGYETTGRSLPAEYKSLLSQGRECSPHRHNADSLEMMQGQFDSGSAISSFQSTYGRLHTNTPANSVVELTIERVCRSHHADRKRLQYRPGILGRGLFGTVCIGSLNGTSVIVKELATVDEKQISEFGKQIEMFSKCDHDYVTRLIGVCSDPSGPPLILLEYCENGNLYELLTGLKRRNSALSEDCQLRMCLQVAQALDHIHRLGFVHADLGCRSILVTQEFNLKLSNLGPCLDRFSGQYAHSSSNTLMPIRWLPPEAVLHDQCGIKADVWSFGVVVMEIFSMGRKPYARLSDAEVLMAAQQPNFRPELPDTLPPQLGPLLDHCWSPTPDRRPTAGQIVARVAELTRDLADV